MSTLEEQAFLAQRQQPHFDRASVDGATFADLDEELVALWSQTATARDPLGLGRFHGPEQLFRAGILGVKALAERTGL